jgi:hypothetical protein
VIKITASNRLPDDWDQPFDDQLLQRHAAQHLLPVLRELIVGSPFFGFSLSRAQQDELGATIQHVTMSWYMTNFNPEARVFTSLRLIPSNELWRIEDARRHGWLALAELPGREGFDLIFIRFSLR